ncbi:heterokaryon incompatibility protein-domain-containing protein [Durotheca rogersii]|uniref:heterokaryon incompatibility protein-domain-containing protein n=1 Tax=Durotheca rogersii TaxID=419775 RepID=UPI00221F336F|nr:heterokaryon incompatibility protein-domain-containing protein [Durotheca rogersii]KAI5867452.1 heterokaryon incompatibility protein-domain-containing protein [Durotheca rogersii]
MSLCLTCSSLDLAGVLRRALVASARTEEEDSGDEVEIKGWHSHGRDVFNSAADCQLCGLISRGWRSSRLKVIEQNFSEATFDPETPPEDLHDDIGDIDAYCDGQVDVQITKRRRFSSEGEKLSFILTVSCNPTSSGSWEVHDGLEAECRITHPAGGGDCGKGGDLDIGVAVGEDPMSAAAICTAKAWLQTCLEQHESCWPELPVPAVPTRLLDVGDGAHDDRIFLLDGSAAVDNRYVALSHCWGIAQQLRTTKVSLESHRREGISGDRLPCTFRDAARVVRALGLRYVWIDSLCIVQDDVEDWRREAERMADVYRNAHLVLAAARGASDDEGFLGPRPLGGGRVDFVTATRDSSGTGGRRLVLHLLPSSPPDDHAHPTDGEPLSLRAWCLQERYLARRAIHYGARQTFWECARTRVAEDGDACSLPGDQLSRVARSAGVPTTVFNLFSPRGAATAGDGDGNNDKNDDVDENGGDGDGDEGDDVIANYADWYAMIEEYTGRGITRDSDRLPALLGLAHALGAVTGDRHIVGIWFGGLLEGLAWCAAAPSSSPSSSSPPAEEEAGPLTRPVDYPAPSWSWIAVRGRVHFPTYGWHAQRAGWKQSCANFEPLATWVGHTIEARDVPTLGSRLIDGELRLDAPMIRVADAALRARKPPMPAEGVFGQVPERSPVTDRTFCFRHSERELWIDGAFDVEGEADAASRQLYIVLLMRLPFVVDFEFFEHCFGLLVEREDEEQRRGGGEKYRRVGFVDGCLLGPPEPPTAPQPDDLRVLGFPKVKADRGDGDSGEEELSLNLLAHDPIRLEKVRVALV